MTYEFVSPSVLPPVDCPLVISVPAGTEIRYGDGEVMLCLTGELLRVHRTSHLTGKDNDMEFWLIDSGCVTGRFPWTYP